MCTAEAANDVMESFNFSSKAYLFDEVISMPMKAEVTASCNPKLGDRLFDKNQLDFNDVPLSRKPFFRITIYSLKF